MSNEFDLIIIGAGPGGYVAAIRAAQLGQKVALIDKRAELGGTCLNVGCIPSKALLHMSHEREHLTHLIGVEAATNAITLATVHAHREKTVSTLRNGVKALVSKRGVTIITAAATVKAAGVVEAAGVEYRAKRILLATGSKPVQLPSLPFNGTTVVSSDEALTFPEAPKNLVVVGGGAIGLELGQVWSRLGSKVTILEFLPQIAAGFDTDVAQALEKSLVRRGMTLYTSTRVTGFNGHAVEADREGEPLRIEADKVLVAAGRAPNTEGLGLEALGVEKDTRGRVKVDADFQTNIKGIYAIGDLIEGPMLAHKAEEDGVAFAEKCAGQKPHVDYGIIPGVVYTDPEVSSVGLTERAAADKNIPVKVGKFTFAGNGRAIASQTTEGFVKLIAHAETDRLLGAQILGDTASELIGVVVAHMTYGASAEDLARTVAAHPTLSEVLKEAALAVDKRALHSL